MDLRKLNAMSIEQKHKRSPTGMAEKMAERRSVAIRLRKLGLGYREIAEQTNVTVGTAYSDVQSVLAEVAALRQETAEEYIQLELERLDAGTMALNEKAAAGNIGAIEAQRKHGESRRKLLGLDAVGKHEHSGLGGQPIPVITEIRRVIVYPDGKEP